MLEDFNINAVLGFALGYLIAQLIRWVRRIKFWRNVQNTAQSYIASPDVPIDDAKQATEVALTSLQQPQIEKITRSIRQSVPPATAPKWTGENDTTPKLNKKDDGQ